jgi:hypothetical protein
VLTRDKGRRRSGLKLPTEHIERLNRCVAKLNEAWNEWVRLSRPEFLKRYVKGEVAFHFHVRVHAGIEPHSQDFCAILCRPDMAGPTFGNAPNEFCVGYLRRRGERQSTRADNVDGHHDKQGVLIGDIEIVENHKAMVRGVGISGRSFVIRLAPLNECLGRPSDALYYSPFSGFYKFLLTGANGKLYPEIGRRMILENERPNQMVEA